MCCRCVYWCFFFFFKQKTAYEMRISDWSSDVCSSDHRQLIVERVIRVEDMQCGVVFACEALRLRQWHDAVVPAVNDGAGLGNVLRLAVPAGKRKVDRKSVV